MSEWKQIEVSSVDELRSDRKYRVRVCDGDYWDVKATTVTASAGADRKEIVEAMWLMEKGGTSMRLAYFLNMPCVIEEEINGGGK
jgi:hypothetical protein